MNFDTEIQQFRKELRLRWYSYNSIEIYASCVTTILYRINKPLSAITIDDLKEYLLTVTNRNTHKQNNAALHRFWEYILKVKLSFDDLPCPPKTNFLPNILSPQEILSVCRAIHLLKQRVAIQTIYSCGLRISEIINLKLEDINFGESVLKVCDSKGNKDRYIPIPQGTLKLIQGYIEKDKPRIYLLNGWLNELQYSEASIRAILRDALKKCGIKRRIRVHDLRHSRLSHLADKKMSFNYLKDFAGHSSEKTTLLYTHTSVETMRSQMNDAGLLIMNQLSKPIPSHQLNQSI